MTTFKDNRLLLRLRDALRAAYVDDGAFDELLLTCDKSLDDLSPSDRRYPIRIKEVIKIANSEGWISCLIARAREQRPQDPDIKRIEDELEALASMPVLGGSKHEELSRFTAQRVQLKNILAGHDLGEAVKKTIEEQLAIVQRSIDKLNQEAAQEAVIPSKPTDLTSAEVSYLEHFTQAHRKTAEIYSDISIAGQLSKTSRRLTDAATEFIELHHEVYKALSHAFEATKTDVVIVDTFADLFKIVSEYQRIALIGDPGAGKTTTLEKLAHEFGVVALRTRSGPIPVFVDLSVRGNTLKQLIEQSASPLAVDAYPPHQLIVFFDGLNEASEEIVDALVDWLTESPARRALVSCRKLDYLDRKLPMRRVDLQPLDVRQIYNLIGRFFQDDRDKDVLFWALAGQDAKAAWQWYRTGGTEFPSFENFWHGKIGHAYSYEIEKRKIAEIQEKARSKQYPGVLDIVTNPFLLFISIIIFFDNSAPPESRGKLFERFVHLMLGRGWSPSPDDSEKLEGTVTPIKVLSNVAFQMIQDGQGTGVTEKWLRSFLMEYAQSLNVDGFISNLKRSGIMEWRGDQLEIVKFRHQLLQEYFASLKLREMVSIGTPATEFWSGDAWWEHTPWDEVVVLLADIEDDQNSIVRWLAPTNPSLAFRCVSGMGAPCSDDLLDTILNESSAQRICPVARAEWGRRLSRSGDHRRGVSVGSDGFPDIEWVRVPCGSFKMGGDDTLKHLGLFVPERNISLSHPYLIAKYPVTYAQYETFVENGYRRDELWTPSGLEWRSMQTAPRLWNDPKFHLANHPVVGVTWFEAIAFANWMNEVEHLRGWRPDSLGDCWTVSLPTEAEWEKAARYPDGRRFPWGDTYRPGAANIDETYQGNICGPYSLRSTTAVGLYDMGVSSLGAHDMCGNVWEWCLSKWDVEYRFPEDVSLAGNVHRGVRGGSWYNSLAFAPSAAHDCQDSDLGVNDVGLRLVLRPLHALTDQ